MKTDEQEIRKCWKCGKTLEGNSKFGLCPGCLNECGTPVAVALSALTVLAVKNRDKIANSAVKVAKAAIGFIKH